MKKTNFRVFADNLVKGILYLLIFNIFGLILYTVFLNGRNADIPENAAIGTSILSIAVFAVSVYLYARFALMGSLNDKRIDERALLEEAFKASEYKLDYNAYFKEQVKKRLCGYYVAAALWQIPLIINYAIVMPTEFTIYETPITMYKWGMTSIFGYELLGKLWYLGPVVFLVLFLPIFTFLVYKGQKKWLVKPSYIK
jgi:hypothetical protein